MADRPPTTPLLAGLAVPIVQAPMAGGPSTPELAAAVARGGGLGFLAAGYLSPARLAGDLAALRALSDAPFGVNVFAATGEAADPDTVAAYAARLEPEAASAGVELGAPRFDDDAFEAKLQLLLTDGNAPAAVSFTFGAPPHGVVDDLHAAGCEVWLTVTSPAEARQAVGLGADAVVVQGVEAGGHRGVFVDDDDQSDLTLLAALQLIGAEIDLPMVAAGALTTGAAVAAVLALGAAAAQVGTAYLCSAEAGTSPAQRAATVTDAPTVLTRAFSGRTARGITNRFHTQHGDAAPRAYPEVHHVTSPLRAHARSAGDAGAINLWAGQAHALVTDGVSAEVITRELAHQARESLAAATARLG